MCACVLYNTFLSYFTAKFWWMKLIPIRIHKWFMLVNICKFKQTVFNWFICEKNKKKMKKKTKKKWNETFLNTYFQIPYSQHDFSDHFCLEFKFYTLHSGKITITNSYCIFNITDLISLRPSIDELLRKKTKWNVISFVLISSHFLWSKMKTSLLK